MRRRPARLQSAKERIEEVALDLFYRRGIHAVGISEITAAAGVTKPTLYQLFKSKDDLVEECVVAETERMFSAIRVNLTNIEDHRSFIIAILRLFTLDTFSDERRGLFLLNAAAECPEADHPVREIVAAVVEELRNRLVAVLGSGVGDLVTAAAAADHVILLIQGASAGYNSVGRKASVAALEASVETVLRHYELAGPLTLPSTRQIGA